MVGKEKARVETILYSFSRVYLHHKKMEYLNKHGEDIKNYEFKKARKDFKKYKHYSKEYDIVMDLFWKRYDFNFERRKNYLCVNVS